MNLDAKYSKLEIKQIMGEKKKEKKKEITLVIGGLLACLSIFKAKQCIKESENVHLSTTAEFIKLQSLDSNSAKKGSFVKKNI